MHRDLDAARVKIGAARKGRTQPVRGRLMTPQQMAVEHYADQMRFDDEARNADHRYSIGYLDQDYMMIWSRRERNRSSAPVSRRTLGFMANLPAGLSAAVNHASSQP